MVETSIYSIGYCNIKSWLIWCFVDKDGIVSHTCHNDVQILCSLSRDCEVCAYRSDNLLTSLSFSPVSLQLAFKDYRWAENHPTTFSDDILATSHPIVHFQYCYWWHLYCPAGRYRSGTWNEINWSPTPITVALVVCAALSIHMGASLLQGNAVHTNVLERHLYLVMAHSVYSWNVRACILE